jgi:hypothetical protein
VRKFPKFPDQFEITQADLDAARAHRDRSTLPLFLTPRHDDPGHYYPSKHCPASRALSRVVGRPVETAFGTAFSTGAHDVVYAGLRDWQNRFDAERDEHLVGPASFGREDA